MKRDSGPVSRGPAPVLRAAVLASVLCLAAAGCGAGGDGADDKGAAARAGITITPAAGSAAVPVNRRVTVHSGSGELSAVRVSAPSVGVLDGVFSENRRSWTSRARLAPGVTYVVRAQGKDGTGAELSEELSFTTAEAAPGRRLTGVYSPDPGTVVGVAMPVSVLFDRPVGDRAAVERRLRVTSVPPVEGSWSWLKDHSGRDRVDYRPRGYWPAGARVTLRMALDGVDAGGVYGTQNRVVTFRVGEAVRTVVDVRGKTMTVTRNGRMLRTLPVSTGKPGFETWNGTMVVLGKVPVIRMNSQTVGIFGGEAYDLGQVRWDVRLTTSGTFVHAAPWNNGKFGRVNGSHGCIGLSTQDAGWFYRQVRLGDPVTVVKSKDTVSPGNGYGDWNVPWGIWWAGSALH